MREVIPETVGQYIGCKDENGVMVFEGDILERHTVYGIIDRIVVGYECSGFTYASTSSFNRGHQNPIDDNEYGIAIDWYTVIGNIHDNTELLEVK